MNDTIRKHLMRSTIMAGLATAGFAAPAYAQIADPDQGPIDTTVELIEEQVEEDNDTIVVTGSRVRRDTFSSISPLQVITADTVIDAGLTSTADIVKSQTVISGVQLDTNVNSSFVTNSGPGSSNVSLRGLGADRTLVLVNGRRLAPAGVEGAPSLPDLNLVPSTLIERVDTLLDGASSVYGSDAVAGVVNVILRDEFDGFRVDGSFTHPFENGGGIRRVSGLFGNTGENGKFIAAVEYRTQDQLNFRDRDYQRADNGQFCSLDIERNSETGETFRNCGGAIGSAEFRSFTSPFGEGDEFGDTGFFGITNSRDPLYRSNDLEAFDDLLLEQESLTAYVSGDRELNLIGSEPAEFFFETSFANTQTNSRNGFHGQLFPTVPADNPTNPFGFAAVPVIFSPIERSNIDVDILQYRAIAGLRGDVSGVKDWSYEVYGQYSRSIGDSVRPAVSEDRLNLALNTTVENDDGSLSCGLGESELFGFITVDNCVPINLFAPSLYDGRNPQFATQEEFDYLNIERSVTTKVDQLNLAGYFTGPIFNMPTGAGEVQAVLGAEYRVDGLNSGVDTVAATGGAAGFSADLPSIGQVSQFEAFAELDIPLLNDKPFFEDLSVNLSGRVVDNEFYNSEYVYAVKAGWSPIDFLTLKGSYGTSYRSPGVRELFLGGRTGFGGGFDDPCIVPANQRGPEAVVEQRNPIVLQNCQSLGIDTDTFGLDGTPGYEVATRGDTRLDPETSDALTLGFVFDQPFTDAFDLIFSLSYFDIGIDDAPQTPGAVTILSRCFNSTSFPDDPFCTRITRDSETNFLDLVDNTPLNLASFGAEGYDMNLRAGFDFNAGGREFTVTADNVITRQTSRESQDLDTAPLNEAIGDFGFPEWRGTFNWRIATGDLSFFWGTRWIGEQEDLNRQTGEVIVRNPDGRLAATGGRVDSDVVVQEIDDYFRHDVSVRYNAGDDWQMIIGINNVFDENPPLLDQDAGATLVGNVPAGIGYDYRGRSMFVTASKTF